ncbi:SAF domain-containing protein [Kitasatospora sp. NPDC057015]|uniref:SAF domain-containing protein n=1 Tax=Kitasatospora sp. NPDC057015 TaxID=3346001 RepID=UPI0036299755
MPEPARSAPVTPPRTLRARRRRPAVLAMAVALIAAGGLGGAVLYTSSGQRIAVLALAHDVPYGQVLTANDLVVARIASDPALKPLSAADRARVVGMRAAADLKQGALLVKADIAQGLTVQPGELVVGIAAKRTQLPATKLQPGVAVIVVSTPENPAGQGGGTVRTPESVAAVVTAVGKTDTDGSQVIDVAVPAAEGVRLAAWVASAKFQVVLAPRGEAPAPAPAPSGTAASGATPAAPASGGTSPGAVPSGSASPRGGA